MTANPDRINVIDLFAGCGGFTQGLREFLPPGATTSPFRTVGAVEWDIAAASTYAANFAEEAGGVDRIFAGREEGDITHWNPGQIKDEVDVILGGPPCQGFSSLGKEDSGDPRNALWQQYMRLWQVTAQRMMGQPVEPVVEPAKGDKRFSDPAWKDEVVFDYLKQSYLLTARWLQSTVKEVEGIDAKTAQKVEFYTRQFADAMSPSNFAMTNPQVVRATIDSRGENLIKGLQNLLTDLERGNGRLAIRQTDMKAFKVGGNVATSPGKVV